MARDLTKALALYPMVEEGEATGRVAAVYGQILKSMPFVPSLFKSLATCPAYLVLAWDQASHALADAEFTDAAASLSASARSLVEPPADPAAREDLARFVGPLGRMLLLSTGLLGALEGRVHGPAASPQPPPGEPVEPSGPVPSQWDVEAWDVYGDIRRALDTPMINSIWRSLAGSGTLQDTWQVLAPQVEASRPHADRLQQRAVEWSLHYQWPVVAGPDALDAAGVVDALPGQAAILDAYVKTLPRLLVLAGSSVR